MTLKVIEIVNIGLCPICKQLLGCPFPTITWPPSLTVEIFRIFSRIHSPLPDSRNICFIILLWLLACCIVYAIHIYFF